MMFLVNFDYNFESYVHELHASSAVIYIVSVILLYVYLLPFLVSVFPRYLLWGKLSNWILGGETERS